MKIKVMYHSKGGNTKKIADAIAEAVGQVNEAVPPAYPLDNVALLFLGGAPYAGKIDKKLADFIKTLNTSRVRNVALFGTTGSQDSAINEMKSMLKAQGINVLDETFLCKGKYFVFFNRKHPNEADTKAAKEFAQRAVLTIKE